MKAKHKCSQDLTFPSKKVIFVKGKSDDNYQAVFEIENKSKEDIAIKVKTNASEIYIVKPNITSIAPLETKRLQIISQPSLNIVK